MFRDKDKNLASYPFFNIYFLFFPKSMAFNGFDFNFFRCQSLFFFFKLGVTVSFVTTKKNVWNERDLLLDILRHLGGRSMLHPHICLKPCLLGRGSWSTLYFLVQMAIMFMVYNPWGSRRAQHSTLAQRAAACYNNGLQSWCWLEVKICRKKYYIFSLHQWVSMYIAIHKYS